MAKSVPYRKGHEAFDPTSNMLERCPFPANETKYRQDRLSWLNGWKMAEREYNKERHPERGVEHSVVECNNEECPMHEGGECFSSTSMEIYFHPNYPASFACWWDDNNPGNE